MADTKPLNRQELRQFLPNERAVKAFEQLFKTVAPQSETSSLVTEQASAQIRSLKSENEALRRRIEQLEVLVNRLPPLSSVNKTDLINLELLQKR